MMSTDAVRMKSAFHKSPRKCGDNATFDRTLIAIVTGVSNQTAVSVLITTVV